MLNLKISNSVGQIYQNKSELEKRIYRINQLLKKLNIDSSILIENLSDSFHSQLQALHNGKKISCANDLLLVDLNDNMKNELECNEADLRSALWGIITNKNIG